ncbi:hypothetical protein FOZ63_018806, partial [Perkinsus olseni]
MRLLIAVTTTFTGATVFYRPPALPLGYYEMVEGSQEIPSLDGLSMRYSATPDGPRADLKFKHEDGREFALDRCALQKLPSRTNDDETRRELSRMCYVVQKIASARTLLVGMFFRETMNHEFSNLGIQNDEGFLICPAGGGKSVTI